MMDHKQLQLLFNALGIADAPYVRISEGVKKISKKPLSPNYARMIILGERTGYSFRPMIAKVLRQSEDKIFGSRKKRRRTDAVPRQRATG